LFYGYDNMDGFEDTFWTKQRQHCLLLYK
jgi:hypothetical protein